MDEKLQNADDQLDLLLHEWNQLTLAPKFAFPSDVLKYIKKNATARQICKLMKINKYFFQYFRPKEVQHIRNVRFHSGLWIYSKFTDEPGHYTYACQKFIKNLWYTDRLCLSPFATYTAFPPSFVCNLKELQIQNFTMSFEDFIMITSAKKVEQLQLESTFIEKDDGNDATFEDILRCLPSIVSISLTRKIPSLTSLINVKKVLPRKLCHIETWELPHAYDRFGFFMKKYKQINYVLHFDNGMYAQGVTENGTRRRAR